MEDGGGGGDSGELGLLEGRGGGGGGGGDVDGGQAWEDDGPLLFSMRGSVSSVGGGGSASSGSDVFHDAEDWDDEYDEYDEFDEFDEYEGPDDDGDVEARGVGVDGGGGVGHRYHSAADHAATLLERSVHLCMVGALGRGPTTSTHHRFFKALLKDLTTKAPPP